MTQEKRLPRCCFALGALAVAGLASGCGEDRAAPKPAQTSPTQAAGAPTAANSATAHRAGDDALVVSGPLVVEHQLDLMAQRDGIIAKIFADTGKHLKAGDMLAQLDDRQIHSELEATRAKTRSIEADLKNWQAEEKVLQSDYERAKKMWDADLLPKEQLEHAQFKVESQEWEIRRVAELLTNSKETERGLELELEKTRIRAPFEGIVARRYIREGQSVTKADRLFWVTAEAPLRLRFTVPEKYMNRLKLGQELTLTSANQPTEEHKARVIEISPVVDPASGTIEALVELIGPAGKLRAGMTASLRIEIGK
ncbi:MAG: efflux RND transporter periplasmic adaptor subunit [Acidobacteria bacterium]|nr:efflux RND transporter periplasmic adaptor subunit [Acidobacteriota bacterium]